MARASSGVKVRPFNRTMRLITSCQPSGVVRSHDMRVRFPLLSCLWQPPHRATTSGSDTGIPSTGFSWATGAGGWAFTQRQASRMTASPAGIREAMRIVTSEYALDHDVLDSRALSRRETRCSGWNTFSELSESLVRVYPGRLLQAAENYTRRRSYDQTFTDGAGGSLRDLPCRAQYRACAGVQSRKNRYQG